MGRRFTYLDELRGVAAVSVAILHAAQAFDFPIHAQAYLAVDFFFCLSGFVLSKAYEERLHRGNLGGRSFLLKRVLRLYPMIFIGVVLGIIATLLSTAPEAPGLGDVPMLAVSGLLLLPYGLFLGIQAYPLNNPLWSLFFELAVNALYGFAGAGKRRLVRDVVVLCGLAAALCVIIFREGTVESAGYSNWWTFLEGLPRVGYSFFAGVLIARWNVTARLPRVRSSWPLILLLVILFTPLPREMGPELFAAIHVAYDIVGVTLGLPLVVALASTVTESSSPDFGQHMGRLSYPFYAIHQPVIRLVAEAQKASGGVVPLPASVALALVAAGGLAQLLSVHIEEPVLKWLARAKTPSRKERALNTE